MFFYEVGYRLGLTNQMLSNAKSSESGYSSDQGCETLLKYATMFGLNQTTGIEIPESSPQVSDQDSVRSAIGQGTNNYTTTQLARYVTAIANRGTVYNLSLLDHVENKDGKVTKNLRTGCAEPDRGCFRKYMGCCSVGNAGSCYQQQYIFFAGKYYNVR